MEKNPIVELAQLVQKIYGENIETRVVSKVGPDHNPTITVEIELPDGRIYTASSFNKRKAKRIAALKALDDFNNM